MEPKPEKGIARRQEGLHPEVSVDRRSCGLTFLTFMHKEHEAQRHQSKRLRLAMASHRHGRDTLTSLVRAAPAVSAFSDYLLTA